jgi:hypothetical protein
MPRINAVPKYHNKKVMIDGHWFDSKREAAYYSELKMLKMARVVADIELQPVFELQPGFKRDGKKVLPITYRADFKVTYTDGRIQVIDVKGMRTQQYILRKKMLLFKYPEIDFVEVR